MLTNVASPSGLFTAVIRGGNRVNSFPAYFNFILSKHTQFRFAEKYPEVVVNFHVVALVMCVTRN